MDELRDFTDVFKFYNPKEIPKNWMCYLLGDEQLSFIKSQWKDFAINGYGENDDWKHPMRNVESIECTVIHCDGDYLNVKFIINRINRFHIVHRVLPVKELLHAFEVICIEKYPYLIVKQQWFNEMVNSNNSTYAYIDFIGIKKIIYQNGKIPTAVINPILNIINRFSTENPEMIFLTLADNIVIKASWNIFVGNLDYEPEKFMTLLQVVLRAIKDEAGIQAYCIVTQGTDYIKEEDIEFSSPQSSNHFFLSSISVPFKDAFEIDDDVRKKVKGDLRKSDFYIEESFYYSLKRNYFSGKEPIEMNKQHVISQNSDREISYFPLTLDEVSQLVKFE